LFRLENLESKHNLIRSSRNYSPPMVRNLPSAWSTANCPLQIWRSAKLQLSPTHLPARLGLLAPNSKNSQWLSTLPHLIPFSAQHRTPAIIRPLCPSCT